MTRRAKLNLTPDEKTSKKKPVSFQSEDNQTKSESRPEQEADQQQTANQNEHTADNVSSSVSLPSWLNRKNLLRAALLVGAAAVTAYYIKRRFR